MLKKFGVNTTRVEKRVAGVRPSAPASQKKFCKVVTCAKCGKRFEKSCPEEYLCEVVNNSCPNCGASLE